MAGQQQRSTGRTNGQAAGVLEPDEILAPAGGALEQQTRGEIDIQIATARRFPRSIEVFQKKALSMATVDEETAASCFYVLPKRKGADKPIEGPSARLAEIVASAWGHMAIAGRIVEEGDRFVVAQGVAWDLENNVRRSAEVRRRITTKDGGRYSDDMIAVTCNAAIAIATRNAVFQVVPQAYTRQIYHECRAVAIGTAQTLGTKRAKMLEYYQKLGVEPARVFGLLEVRGIDDITLEHIGILRGLATAIKEGDTSIDEAFPPAGAVHGPDPVQELLNAIPEAQRALVVGMLDQLAMNRAQRLVQLRAFKGQPDKLVEVLAGMLDAQKAEDGQTTAGSAPGAVAHDQAGPAALSTTSSADRSPSPAAPSQPTTAAVTSKPAAPRGRFDF